MKNRNMKNLVIIIILIPLIFVGCKNNDDIKNKKELESSKKNVQIIKEDDLDICKNKDTLTFQDEKLLVKSEFTMRGDGVLSLDIIDKLIIYNQDETVFGEISMTGESTYDLNLPKTIVARYFAPMFDQFVFDAPEPNKKSEYLEMFVNKELKKIKKNTVSYNFEFWNDYVKKSFINVRYCNINNKKNIDKNTYEIVKISNDSMNIRAISKVSCDAISNYVETKKTIRWKKNNELLIYFYECN